LSRNPYVEAGASFYGGLKRLAKLVPTKFLTAILQATFPSKTNGLLRDLKNGIFLSNPQTSLLAAPHSQILAGVCNATIFSGRN
jgi:hypothetical protein